jgi:hypothetical protein
MELQAWPVFKPIAPVRFCLASFMAGVLDWKSTMIGAISLSLGDLRLGDLRYKSE